MRSDLNAGCAWSICVNGIHVYSWCPYALSVPVLERRRRTALAAFVCGSCWQGLVDPYARSAVECGRRRFARLRECIWKGRVALLVCRSDGRVLPRGKVALTWSCVSAAPSTHRRFGGRSCRSLVRPRCLSPFAPCFVRWCGA